MITCTLALWPFLQNTLDQSETNTWFYWQSSPIHTASPTATWTQFDPFLCLCLLLTGFCICHQFNNVRGLKYVTVSINYLIFTIILFSFHMQKPKMMLQSANVNARV